MNPFTHDAFDELLAEFAASRCLDDPEDRMAVAKLLSRYIRQELRSPDVPAILTAKRTLHDLVAQMMRATQALEQAHPTRELESLRETASEAPQGPQAAREGWAPACPGCGARPRDSYTTGTGHFLVNGDPCPNDDTPIEEIIERICPHPAIMRHHGVTWCRDCGPVEFAPCPKHVDCPTCHMFKLLIDFADRHARSSRQE